MDEIKKKGFTMTRLDEENQDQMDTYVSTDFSRVGRGVKALTDAVFKLGDYQRIGPRAIDRDAIVRAMHSGDYAKMR